LPIYPAKGYTANFPIHEGNAPTVGGVDEELLVAWAPLGDKLRMTSTAEFAGYDRTARESAFGNIMRLAQELFPDAADYAAGERTTGQRVDQARRGQVAYGYSVRIICLQYYLPFTPGDVGNASTYDFPGMYREVKGATFDAIIVRQDPAMAPLIVEAAQELVRQGAKAVTSDCGYFGAYQREVADAVPVPVFL